ncbi:MAG: hypothetical protein OEQ29_00930 [Alphaproteobacteria bacterium]|nr:hypothetical protein [Alphaproteobacteria bacterium]
MVRLVREKKGSTEDPKFKKVVEHFLKTPPRPRSADKKGGEMGGGPKDRRKLSGGGKER